ncbi:MAG: EVE domain-containing protein, partial [Chitinophagaceae bacterium]
EIVGIAKVVKEHYQDPTTEETAWVVVDLKPVKKLNNAVTLAQLKNEPQLASMEMLRLTRLSVTKVSDAEWKAILKLANEK